MSNNLQCSLVTPTYNWPEALELLLLSILDQTQLPDEVIVADDKRLIFNTSNKIYYERL